MEHNQNFEVTGKDDKPLRGAWHNGPNPCWITVTHKPTMMAVRCYGLNQHKTMQTAKACLELMLDDSGVEECRFPENLK